MGLRPLNRRCELLAQQIEYIYTVESHALTFYGVPCDSTLAEAIGAVVVKALWAVVGQPYYVLFLK